MWRSYTSRRADLELAVCHLTRMAEGRICAAGVDLATGRQVRPVVAEGGIDGRWLSRGGGPFELARVLRIRSPSHAPQPPHTEDYVFDPEAVQLVRVMQAGEFWELLERLSVSSFRQIFGTALRRAGSSSCGTGPHRGVASLGIFRPCREMRLSCHTRFERPQVRMPLADEEFTADLPVNDIRLYQEDRVTPNAALVSRLAGRLRPAEDVLLSLGLTRLHKSSTEPQGAHWLQVNNIHLRAEPLWQG